MTSWLAAQKLEESGQPFVVITLISTRGHAPQDPGAKAIVTQEGLCHGTIGGGKVEARAIEMAMSLLEAPPSEPQIFTWNLQRDIGMTCGGEVSLLFEHHHSRQWSIAVFGAGHVAQALVRTLSQLDCHITCLDSRSEWLEKLPAHSRLDKFSDSDLTNLVSKFNEKTFFVIMTQGHSTDLPILEKIFRTFPKTPYVGVMGSDIKSLRIRDDLKSRGIEPSLLEKLRCPIGVDGGRNAPAEIAICVATELLQARDSL